LPVQEIGTCIETVRILYLSHVQLNEYLDINILNAENAPRTAVYMIPTAMSSDNRQLMRV